MGKLIFAVFGGTSPVIKHLQIESVYDQIPDDLMECWACCFWAVQASSQATRAKPIMGHSTLIERVYKLTHLRPDDMLDDRIVQVMERVGDRFATRLSLDNQAIMNAHNACVNRLI